MCDICLYCRAKIRKRKIEAWLYLSNLLKCLGILEQHEQCKFWMGVNSELLKLQTEPSEHRLRAK